MPRIPWNPRNYSYGAGSNLGPAALNTLRDGKGYVGSDGLVHVIIMKKKTKSNKL